MIPTVIESVTDESLIVEVLRDPVVVNDALIAVEKLTKHDIVRIATIQNDFYKNSA